MSEPECQVKVPLGTKWPERKEKSLVGIYLSCLIWSGVFCERFYWEGGDSEK